MGQTGETQSRSLTQLGRSNGHHLYINIPECTSNNEAEIERQMSTAKVQVSKPGSKNIERKFMQEKERPT
jgi:hypothetical protein